MKSIIGLAVAGLVFAGSTQAGQVQPAEVEVDLVNLTAGGDMVTARFANDPDVFIGCGSRVISDGAGGTFIFGFCQAEDDEGERAFCNVFTDTLAGEALLHEISSFSDFAFVTFSWDEVVNPDGSTSNICSRVGSSTQSFYIPNFKKPRKL